MMNLSQQPHAVQQIDADGVMIGISRQWYEEAKAKLAEYEAREDENKHVWVSCNERLPTAYTDVAVICDGIPTAGWVSDDGQWFVQRRVTAKTVFSYWCTFPE